MTETPPRLLVVLRTIWDRKQFEVALGGHEPKFEVVYAEPSDIECPSDFDALGYIHAQAERDDFEGVFSSSDYPGATIAAAIANARGLIGPDPKEVLEASNKLTSRRKQQASVPEATPKFCLVDPDHLAPPAVGFPCFVKPVKGAFSMFARRVDSFEELRAHLERPEVREFRFDFLGIFNDLWRHYVGDGLDGRYFIAEELLGGKQVTVDGFVVDGEPVVIGVVDSEFHPGTGSFSRFIYPSQLPGDVQKEMVAIAGRCVVALGLRRCFFNIEMVWDGSRVAIVELNPRVCGQFGDLYAKVDGRSAYEVVPELKLGCEIHWPRQKGPFDVAASVPLRVFQPSRVRFAPDEARIAAVEAEFPRTLIWNEVENGQSLSDFASEDGGSCRYAVVNLGAASRDELERKARSIQTALGYELDPL